MGDKFADNYSYQVNLLVKYHKQMGLDVRLIASCDNFDFSGKDILSKPGRYVGEYGIPIIRIPYKKNNRYYYKLKKFIGLDKALRKVNPDIMFIHNVQFSDAPIVVKYLRKNPNIVAYADNHADFSNSATNWFSKNILHKIVWRHYANVLAPYVKKIYGVLPARVDFLINVYGLPKEKCELLVLGADDELVALSTAADSIKTIRDKYGIKQGDFLIVTGGKINKYRPETISLMKAVAKCHNRNVKLVFFGNVEDSMKIEFEELVNSSNITNAGWQNAEGTYRIMAAADLIVFPGLHSIMWEQAVALGVPCVFRDIKGFHHVDLGGNAIFLKDVSENSLAQTIEELSANPSKCNSMRRIAREKGMKTFSYKEIARRSIEL